MIDYTALCERLDTFPNNVLEGAGLCDEAAAAIRELHGKLQDRDRDWILAMGHALGLKSGFDVPIVPEVEPFQRMFAAVREAAIRELRERLAGLKEEYISQEVLLLTTQAEVERLREERTGTIHESWKEKTKDEILDGLKFQGTITKSLLTEADISRAEIERLRKLDDDGYGGSVIATTVKCLEEAEAEVERWKAESQKNATEAWNVSTEVEALRKDAERLDWLERHLFDGKWDGTIGRPKTWHMAGPYRHTLQKMHGNTLREAIDAALAGEKP